MGDVPPDNGGRSKKITFTQKTEKATNQTIGVPRGGGTSLVKIKRFHRNGKWAYLRHQNRYF